VYCEFSRVVGKNLRENFFDALDRFSPSLMNLFRNKRGLTGQVLAELLRHTKTTGANRHSVSFCRGLPVILGDDPFRLFSNMPLYFKQFE
ncbi:sterile alpha motif domain-containing protein 3, partial [Lates japonicus]